MKSHLELSFFDFGVSVAAICSRGLGFFMGRILPHAEPQGLDSPRQGARTLPPPTVEQGKVHSALATLASQVEKPGRGATAG